MLRLSVSYDCHFGSMGFLPFYSVGLRPCVTGSTVAGPPSSTVTCSTRTTCCALAGHYFNASTQLAGTILLTDVQADLVRPYPREEAVQVSRRGSDRPKDAKGTRPNSLPAGNCHRSKHGRKMPSQLLRAQISRTLQDHTEKGWQEKATNFPICV